MARVTLATLKRLDAVERGVLGGEGVSRVGVMRVPRILGLDEWEAIAIPSQQALKLSASEDTDSKHITERMELQHALPEPVPQHDGQYGRSLQTGVVAPVHNLPPLPPKRPPVSIR